LIKEGFAGATEVTLRTRAELGADAQMNVVVVPADVKPMPFFPDSSKQEPLQLSTWRSLLRLLLALSLLAGCKNW